MIRVLAWEKSPILRAGLEALLAADHRFEVVKLRSRTADLRTAVSESTPDVIVLDEELDFPQHSELLNSPGAPPALVLVDQPRRMDMLRMIHYGVRCLLLRDSQPEEVTDAVAAAYRGLAVMSTELLEILAPDQGEVPDEDAPVGEPLTAREIEVLSMLAGGAGNREIALCMGISEHTVKFHVSSILNKLGAATRTEAVSRAYKEGLILL